MTLQEQLQKIKLVSPTSIDNYRYTLYNIEGLNIIKTDTLKTRKDYEEYRRTSNQIQIQHSGENSLRSVKRNNEIIGYILEEKPEYKVNIEYYKSIFQEVFDYIINELEIQDVDSFNYYLDNFCNINFILNEMICKGSIEKLFEILDNYNNDIDYKKFLNKIIKAPDIK